MTTPLDTAVAHAADRQSQTARVKRVLIERLELPIPADWITDDQPLFGRGLELDSLDALELSMAVDQEFGTPVYEENASIFGSVGAFIDFLDTKRTEVAAAESTATDAAPESTAPEATATDAAPEATPAADDAQA